MSSKDYAHWHTKKAMINDSVNRAYFYEREVWWAAIGHNIGDEEDGKGYNFARPVLIIRKFNKSLFYGLPLSTTSKQGKYYYNTTIKGSQSAVLLSHLRDYDAKRLLNKLGTISQNDFDVIKAKLIKLFLE